MNHVETALRNAVAVSRHLAEADPQSEAVQRTVDNLQSQIGLLNELAGQDRSWGEKSMKDDVEFLTKQIQKLKSAASIPARNYNRIVSICEGLRRAAVAARHPENAPIRPHLARIIKKTAGVFSECDTVEDLDKPLEQIEKAVHSLYGDQSKNETFYIDRRGKGHHTKSGD